MTCKPYKSTDASTVMKASLAPSITPKQQLYQLPLTGDSRPSQKKQVFLNAFSDLNGKHVRGIQAISQTTNAPTTVTTNGSFTTLSTDLLANITISFFDKLKNNYSIMNEPLAFYVLGGGTYNSFPFRMVDLVPDMHRSFITINTTTGFSGGATYLLMLNFIYE